MLNNSHHIPLADTGDCTEEVTVTVIGILDIPSATLITTSTNPDDSEPVNCPDANSTVTIHHVKILIIYILSDVVANLNTCILIYICMVHARTYASI